MNNPQRSSDRYPAGTRKQQIVETALRLVATQGTEAVSAQLIADAIGVTQPAVFRHFPSKEAVWLAVMNWLEDQLVAIYAAADGGESGLVVLSRMFLEHAKLIERYPALAKLVLSDHLRLQYPELQGRFGRIHRAYMARISALIDRAKSDGTVADAVAEADAATMFLSLIQGLGFQVAIARLPIRMLPQAERTLGLYLQAVTAGTKSCERADAIVQAAKRPRRLREPM